MFSTPTPVAAAYDHLAEAWDSMYLRPRDRAENSYVYEILREGGYLEGQVLDAGCGTGLLLDIGHVPPNRYTGVDISSEMVRVAGEKYPHYRFMIGNMENLARHPDEGYDSVVSLYCSASYSPRLKDIASEIWRVLRPGGKMLVMLYGKRALRQRAYVVDAKGEEVPRFAYSRKEAAFAFKPYFDRVRVRGMSLLGTDVLARALPARALSRFIALESRTLGRLVVGSGYFVIVEATKLEAPKPSED